MLANCRITHINQLLFIICSECQGTVFKLGNSREDIQRQTISPYDLPDAVQRQQQQTEMKREAFRVSNNFFCNQCMKLSECKRRFTLKITFYYPPERSLKDLQMFDGPATQLFGCTAQEYLELTMKDESLNQRLEDYLVETTWNIVLLQRKNADTNLIASMEPVQSGTPPTSIISVLTKDLARSPSTHHGNLVPSNTKIPLQSPPSLVLDSSLSLYF